MKMNDLRERLRSDRPMTTISLRNRGGHQLRGDLQAADARFAFARGLITYNGVTDILVYAEVDWFEGTLSRANEIHREALAALLLFQEAAREERLTVERIEGFIRYFKKARVNPGLRFGR